MLYLNLSPLLRFRSLHFHFVTKTRMPEKCDQTPILHKYRRYVQPWTWISRPFGMVRTKKPLVKSDVGQARGEEYVDDSADWRLASLPADWGVRPSGRWVMSYWAPTARSSERVACLTKLNIWFIMFEFLFTFTFGSVLQILSRFFLFL